MERSRRAFKVGTSQHFRWLRGITAAIILLNLVDALFTMTWLDLGLATEANPLMEVLTAWGPVPFVLGKVLLVSLGCLLLWRRRQHPLAVVGIFTIFLIYYAIIIHHLRAVKEVVRLLT